MSKHADDRLNASLITRSPNENEIRLFAALMDVLALSPVWADGKPLKIESSTKSQYFVVEKGGTAERSEFVLRRVRGRATSYSKHLYGCEARTTRTLASAKILEALLDSSRNGEMLPVEKYTIANQLWKLACGK